MQDSSSNLFCWCCLSLKVHAEPLLEWEKNVPPVELRDESEDGRPTEAALGKRQAVVSKEEFQDRERGSKEEYVLIHLREFLEHSGSFAVKNSKEQRGMVLPFQPLSSNINYYVDMPLELKQQGVQEDRLQLLVNVSGSFRPAVLTALVGVSGAGKTTLMDVLAGRKTGGFIEGSMHISGYPRRQETFARISGYCEQNDVHSPCLTVRESLIYSASLRLPSHVDSKTRKVFVDEMMELVELTSLSGALVGLPGVNGLSTEQQKRLRIALLFMKRGGQLIYAGPVGAKFQKKLVKFFEGIEGVQKITSGYNSAAWMLEVTSSSEESRLGVDFAEVNWRSRLLQYIRYFRWILLIETLNKPSSDTKDLGFLAKETLLDIFNAMGSMYAAGLFLGVTNSLAVQPVVSVERFVSYREGSEDVFCSTIRLRPVSFVPFMISFQSFVQVAIEFPYVFVQSVIYSTMFYSMASFEWDLIKFSWYIFFMYFTLFGMMMVVTPNHNMAAIIYASFYTLWNLFSGFMIPPKGFGCFFLEFEGVDCKGIRDQVDDFKISGFDLRDALVGQTVAYELLKLYRDMEFDKIYPDGQLLNDLIVAFAKVRDPDRAMFFLAMVQGQGLV
ncbi:hypothetical protein GIB67_032253 [Kingdonia uniflora]|uniref:ABC transporter domain-containing protein n=1 Tax=Kingdonia uniflora TaxID=39325 RepID=A0A7J7MXH3_9MAGN|nr:hypothetical protein GIB67_032253 [Kingdonia uniflora]